MTGIVTEIGIAIMTAIATETVTETDVGTGVTSRHGGTNRACSAVLLLVSCLRVLRGEDSNYRLLLGNHRQHDIRGVFSIVVDRVSRYSSFRVLVKRLTRIRIHIKAWEIAAGNIYANAVTFGKQD